MISTLLGAKLEQPMHPSFNIMLKLLKDTHNVTIDKKVLLHLEMDILKNLQFSMHFVSPIPFLERYQMIFGLEKAQLDLDSDKVRELSRKLCRFMLKDEKFLDFKPS